MAQAMPPLLNPRARRGLLAVFLLILIEGMAGGAAAVATRELFSSLRASVPLPGHWAWVLALSGLLIAASKVAARTWGERLGQEYILEIRRSLFKQASKMNVSDVAARRVGYLSLRFVGDLAAFRNWLALGIPRLMAAMLLIPITQAVLGYLHRPFLIVTLPIYALMLVLIGVYGARLPALHRRMRSRRAAIAADMAERLPLAPQLGHMGRQSNELRLITRKSRRLIDVAQTRVLCAQSLKVVPDLFTGLSALGIIWIGAATGAGASTIAAGLAALALCVSPVRDLANVWNLWSAFRVARDKCESALNRETKRSGGNQGRSLRGDSVSVRLLHTCVHDCGELSCDIPAGARVRLRGETGSGKSQLLMTLAGLNNPRSGEVLLAGKPMTSFSQGSLRRRIARLSDDTIILKGSLRRALTLGLDERPDDERILALASTLGLSGLIDRHGGLDGKVAEGGRTFSRGEKFKIAALRAMATKPALVLVDEPVGCLDANSRRILSEWINSLDSTIIAIDELAALSLDYDQEISMGDSSDKFALQLQSG